MRRSRPMTRKDGKKILGSPEPKAGSKDRVKMGRVASEQGFGIL
jgi:hypothetical protein